MKVLALILLLGTSLYAQPNDCATFESYADAIYKAEGGKHATHPYGIVSIKCKSASHAREICLRTVANNWERWKNSGCHGEFLQFLANVYCPIGADNDPKGLNKNWLKNVRYYLAK